jgi:hypothetical protein
MLTRAAVVWILLATALITLTPVAEASGDCPPGWAPQVVPGGGVICIRASDPGSASKPGFAPTFPSTASSGDGREPACHRRGGARVDCVRPYGVWVSAHQCYAHTVDVPADDPAWGGHAGGAVWMCALIDDTTPVTLFWVPPGGPIAAPPPDPGELARSAVSMLRLVRAVVRVAPAYPAPAIVGVENWLWLPGSQWRVLTKTVRAGGTAVRVTASPDRVVWEMGPGSTTCFGAGRQWVDGMGDGAVTRCGYTYDRTSTHEPGGEFEVTARIVYHVDWSCSGVCTSAAGTLGLIDAPAGVGRVRVVQRQTVVVE